jgi:hypothetical protein
MADTWKHHATTVGARFVGVVRPRHLQAHCARVVAAGVRSIAIAVTEYAAEYNAVRAPGDLTIERDTRRRNARQGVHPSRLQKCS